MNATKQPLHMLSRASSQSERMKWYLFWTFVCLFVVVSLLTILALFFDIGALDRRYESKIVTVFVLAVGSGVVALFYGLFGLKQPATPQAPTSAPKESRPLADPDLVVTGSADAPDISGKWEYVCTTQGATFPDKGRQHGGIADIRLGRTGNLTVVSISGSTEWKRHEDGTESRINFPPAWHTLKGFFTGPDSFEYHYETTEVGERQIGHSKLRVLFEKGEPVRLEGEFSNKPPGPQIYGTVEYTRKDE
jgi:hypothetical protein